MKVKSDTKEQILYNSTYMKYLEFLKLEIDWSLPGSGAREK